jgi:hypothetical protein
MTALLCRTAVGGATLSAAAWGLAGVGRRAELEGRGVRCRVVCVRVCRGWR